MVTFLVVQGLGIISPVLPELADEWGLRDSGAALLLSSMALGRLLFSLPGGALADRYAFRTIAVLASSIVMLFAVLAATTRSYPVLVAAQLGQGMGSGAFTTAAMSVIVQQAPPALVGRALARFQGAILLGLSASPLLGGLAVDLFGITGPFWVYAAGGGVGVVLSAVALPRSSAAAPPPRASPRLPPPPLRRSSLLTNRPLLLANLAGLATLWSVGGVRNTLVPLFAEAEFGFSPVAIGAVLAVAAAANVVALAPAGRVTDTSGRRPAIRIGMVTLTAATFLLVLVVDPWMLVVAVGLGGAAKALVSVAPLAVVADVVDESLRGTAVGLSRTAAELGLVLGPVTVGAISDLADARAAFLWSGVILAVATAATFSIAETMGVRSSTDP